MNDWISALLVPTIGLLFIIVTIYGTMLLVAIIGAVVIRKRGLPSYWRCDNCGNHVPSGKECPYGCREVP